MTTALTREKALAALTTAARRVLDHPSLPHHLSKAASERWLAFELAKELDEELKANGWICLVECGANAAGGNVDLLLVPFAAAHQGARLALPLTSWPPEAVAIELKAAHLGDGSKGVTQALLTDLLTKPQRFAEKGRGCAHWFGVLLTTSGLWEKSANAKNTLSRAQQMDAREISFGPLTCLGSYTRDVEYREWRGKVWIDVLQESVSASQ